MKKDYPVPPAPPCASCGAPAACEVTLEVRDLELCRAAGVSSQPYWEATYKSTRAMIRSRLCSACFQSTVTIETRTMATIVGKSSKP